MLAFTELRNSYTISWFHQGVEKVFSKYSGMNEKFSFHSNCRNQNIVIPIYSYIKLSLVGISAEANLEVRQTTA